MTAPHSMWGLSFLNKDQTSTPLEEAHRFLSTVPPRTSKQHRVFITGLPVFSHYVRLVVIPWTAARQAPLSSTASWGLLKLMSIELVMPSNHLILCYPFSLALCIRWPKYWSFSFSINPSSEYSGLVSFRIDWLNLLALQGTLKSLLQHHSSKASILRCSALWSNLHICTWLLEKL